MGPALKNTYDYFENIKGKKLLYLFAFILIVSLVVGILVGQIPSLLAEPKPSTKLQEKKTEVTDVVEKAGRVVYVNPELYPGQNISYKLVDDNGKDIILLTASDDKLKIIENSDVKLRGKVISTVDGKNQVLFVQEVVFN